MMAFAFLGLLFSLALLFFPIAALTVRYLTGRFIGEYHSNTDLLYNKIIALEAGPTEVEIVDVHDGNLDNDDPHHIEFPMEQVNI